MAFPDGSVVKSLRANAGDAGDVGLIPGSGRSSGEGNGNPLQYACLGNPMDSGAWWATHQEIKKRWQEYTDEHKRKKVLITQITTMVWSLT